MLAGSKESSSSSASRNLGLELNALAPILITGQATAAEPLRGAALVMPAPAAGHKLLRVDGCHCALEIALELRWTHRETGRGADIVDEGSNCRCRYRRD